MKEKKIKTQFVGGRGVKFSNSFSFKSFLRPLGCKISHSQPKLNISIFQLLFSCENLVFLKVQIFKQGNLNFSKTWISESKNSQFLLNGPWSAQNIINGQPVLSRQVWKLKCSVKLILNEGLTMIFSLESKQTFNELETESDI